MPRPTDVSGEGIGERIREMRFIRDLSLAELGRRAHVSAGQLSRIESGHREASPTILGSIARALGVDVSVLRGQPYIHMLQADQLDALLSPISSALDAWDIPPDGEPPPRPLDVLEAELARVVELRLATKFSEISMGLPGLITEVALATQLHDVPGRDRERAYNLQAEVARTAAIIAYRLGFMDLARLALARMAVAAPQSGDPRQVAVERYERAQVTHATAGRPDRGVTLMQRALRDLEDDGEPATRAMRGTLQLRAAMLMAGMGDGSGADGYLGEARELADRTGETNYYAMTFGPANWALNHMAAASYLEDHEQAVARAADVRLPDGYAPTRTAGFHIDLAKAQTWTARPVDALRSLQQARRIAPTLTRYHHSVHETVSTLLRSRQRAPDELREFARWSGV